MKALHLVSGPVADILEALKRVGIPRAKFQIAKLVQRPDDTALHDMLRHMVIRRELDVVPNSVPKLYCLHQPPATKVYEIKTKAFAVAGALDDRYRGYRWGGVYPGRARTQHSNND